MAEQGHSELMSLSNLSPGKGARKNRRRVGRGEGSGAGKTAGRGNKGQKARSGGKVRAGFEGGGMPLYRQIPKVGFRSRQKITGKNQYNLVGLSVLDRFEDGSIVDREALRERGYGTKNRLQAGIKVVANGELSKKVTVRVNAVTASARAKIEAAGGTVELVGAAQADAPSQE